MKVKQLKNILNQQDLIQQYTFIGTKRIATDIFYDFFINFHDAYPEIQFPLITIVNPFLIPSSGLSHSS